MIPITKSSDLTPKITADYTGISEHVNGSDQICSDLLRWGFPYPPTESESRAQKKAELSPATRKSLQDFCLSKILIYDDHFLNLAKRFIIFC